MYKKLKKDTSLAILFVLIVFLFAFSGCDNVGSTKIANSNKTISIEGCQYIIYDRWAGDVGYGYMSHKGNCNNQIHCHNK